MGDVRCWFGVTVQDFHARWLVFSARDKFFNGVGEGCSRELGWGWGSAELLGEMGGSIARDHRCSQGLC